MKFVTVKRTASKLSKAIIILGIYINILLSGKTFQTKQIRADTSHEVSALLVIFVLQKNI